MNLSEINSRLKRGDGIRIARLSGFTQDYVSKVFRGLRRSRKILMIAEMIIKEREAADKQIQEKLKKSTI